MSKIIFIASLCVGVLLASSSARAEGVAFKVIVNAQAKVTQLKKAEVRTMYLKKLTRWKDDVPVTPFDLSGSSPVRDAFTQTTLEMTRSTLLAQWRQRIFTGQGVPPKEITDDATMVSVVGSTPGAIGYVRADAPTSAAVMVVTLTD